MNFSKRTRDIHYPNPRIFEKPPPETALQGPAVGDVIIGQRDSSQRRTSLTDENVLAVSDLLLGPVGIPLPILIGQG